MSDHGPNPQLARALSGDSDEPDRNVPCMRCQKPTTCPGFLIASVKLWNREEKELSERSGRRTQWISYGELIPCDECAPIVREEKRNEYITENVTTQIFLRDLKQGRYNPESLAWLRRAGFGAEVTRYLNEEGTNGR